MTFYSLSVAMLFLILGTFSRYIPVLLISLYILSHNAKGKWKLFGILGGMACPLKSANEYNYAVLMGFDHDGHKP